MSKKKTFAYKHDGFSDARGEVINEGFKDGLYWTRIGVSDPTDHGRLQEPMLWWPNVEHQEKVAG